jgi:hypothetical protein
MARAMLLQAAWQIMIHGKPEDALRCWAERVAQNRKPKIAAVALARKLACVMWAMWRDGTPYDAQWKVREEARGVAKRARQATHKAQALLKAAAKLQRPAPSKVRSTPRKPSRRSKSSEAA